MLKKFLPLIICLILCAFGMESFSQKVIQPKQLDYGVKGILYKEETLFDGIVHSNGFAVGAKFGEIQTYYRTKYFHVNAGIIKHPKEYRQAVNFQNGTNIIKTNSSFAFGKRNNLIALRAGYGVKRYFSEKAKRKGVAVGISYEGGATFGVLKPYYLEISRAEGVGGTESIVSEKYSEDNADLFLNVSSISGAANFFKGFGEVSLAPGFHGKAAMHFSLGAFDQFVRAVEVGFMFDGFFRKVPIMILEKNRSFFFNAYLSVQFGKRK